MQGFFLKSGGEGPKDGEMNAALGIKDVEGFQLGVSDLFQLFGSLVSAEEGRDGVAFKNIREKRKGFVTETVAGGKGFGI